MKIFKIVYYIFLVFIGAIVILLIFSVFPIMGNYKIMTVLSGSMEPAIKMGSVVVVKPADDYKIGDVITFGSYSKTKPPTTHRIHNIKVLKGRVSYITKGDANEEPDNREISEREIIGKVLFSIPYLGYAVDFTKKPIGFALIIIIPAGIVIADEVKKIYAELKKKKTE